MKKWDVTLPIVGSVTVTVKAEDEASAIEAALREDLSGPDAFLEWEAVTKVTRGNVCYAPLNDAYATEIEE